MELCGGEEEYGSHFLCSSQKSQSLFPFPGLMSGSAKWISTEKFVQF